MLKNVKVSKRKPFSGDKEEIIFQPEDDEVVNFKVGDKCKCCGKYTLTEVREGWFGVRLGKGNDVIQWTYFLTYERNK